MYPTRPEIDRKMLREILLDSLPDGIIRWNSNLRHVDLDGFLHFTHGVEKDFGLIVGADGGWSKVRDILTPVKPFYSGIAGVDIKINDIDSRFPELSRRVGRGSVSPADFQQVYGQQLTTTYSASSLVKRPAPPC